MTPVDIDKLKELIARIIHPEKFAAFDKAGIAFGRWVEGSPIERGVRSTLAKADAILALPALIAKAERVDALTAILEELEDANDDLCATRSEATYLHMIDHDGAKDALDRLDAARRAARNALSPKESE